MAAGGMAEEIEDAFFLHQARDEIEIRFAILNAVLPLGIGIVQLPGDIEALQDLLQDIGHLQVLKDAQISLARQHPDLGRDGGAVAGEAEGSGQLCEGGHNAVDVSGFAARRPDYPEGDRLAQDVLEFDPGVFGPQLELEPKELRDGLLPRERLEQQFIRTQARLDVKETILFKISVRHVRPPSQPVGQAVPPAHQFLHNFSRFTNTRNFRRRRSPPGWIPASDLPRSGSTTGARSPAAMCW